jgi:hypothetical protein
MSRGTPILHRYSSPFALRIDIRNRTYEPSLSRQVGDNELSESDELERALKTCLSEIVRKHLNQCSLARSEEGWIYKQSLIEGFPIKEFWASCPKTIRIYLPKKPRLVSLKEACARPTFTTATHQSEWGLLRYLSASTKKGRRLENPSGSSIRATSASI